MVISANILAATQPACMGELFNIATSREDTIEHPANIIQEISGKETTINYADPIAGEVRHSWVNIEKAQKLLGNNPKITLREGLSIICNEESK